MKFSLLILVAFALSVQCYPADEQMQRILPLSHGSVAPPLARVVPNEGPSSPSSNPETLKTESSYGYGYAYPYYGYYYPRYYAYGYGYPYYSYYSQYWGWPYYR